MENPVKQLGRPRAESPRKFAPGVLPNRQKRDHLEWLQTLRFIEEVERLEAEGRCEDRGTVEKRLLLPYNSISLMRAGSRRVSPSAISLLKTEYNGDWQFVLLGVRDEEKASWWRAGQDLRTRPGCRPYVHAYKGKYREAGPDLRKLAGLPVLTSTGEGTKKAEAS